jgi:hypothetical protein
MLRADSIADSLQGASPGWALEDGEEEWRLKSPRISVAVEKDGGAIVEVADRSRPFDFAGVIARRREAYHVRVEEASRRSDSHESASQGAPETIHGAISVKEPGLERLLEYDKRARCASQEWVRSAAEVEAKGGLRGAIGPGPVEVLFAPEASPSGRAGPPLIRLRSHSPAHASIVKEIAPGRDEREFEVRFAGAPAQGWLLSEWNLSLLTPDAPGRRLVIAGGDPRVTAPGSTGGADGVTSIRLEDTEYLEVALTLSFLPAARVEWSPVETVSLSEAGAERVYQGTAFLIGFLDPGEAAPVLIRARVEEASHAV